MKFMNIEDLNIQKFLSTESEQLFWKGEGLPSDNLSLENAMVMLKINPQKPGKALRPFMIDPSSRATEWLKTHMKNNRLEVINQQDSSFGTTLELSVRFGKTLLITEADGIEPLLYPILRGDLIQQGPRFVVQIGDKVIDYNEEFKIFLTTRNPSPELAPDASSIVTIVNFTTTKAGLTGQLLAATIQHEKPELEVKKTELLKAEEKLKIELEKLEASLLEQLANAKGNILENKELLDSLNKTKESSTTISKSLAESKELQIFLDKERGAYLPLAEYASEMFFVISDLFKIDNMYRFSLNSFLSLFNRALDTKDDGLGTESRISTLKSSLLKLVYNYVSRSLFKADRLMFAIHMVHGMFPTIFEENEWEYFIGILVVDTKGEKDIELPDWVEKDRSQAVLLLKHAFPDLFEKLSLKDLSGWSKFARSAECEDDIPSHIDKNCGIFQHLLTISAIRPDRLQSAMTTFACKALSMDELSPPNVNLKKLYEDETSPDEPILIIISTGADPSQDLEELAKEIVGSDKYFQVAMGQGQAEIAMKLLKECSENGSWLCLKNLHLVTSWLGTLEKSIKSLKLHPNFRLWFTAESHPKFPPILLQSTLKITYEAPPGVKKNLLRTYEAWGPSFISAGGNSERSQAMFVLAWFHSVMSERRNFLPQGWTKFYEFSFSDLRAGAEVIDRLFKRTGKGNQIPWNFVHGLMENAIYGGRVDNIFDQRVLKSFLLQYFNTNQISPQAKANRKLGPMKMQSSTNSEDYMTEISKLQELDRPAYFGLPENIERATQQSIGTSVIGQLRTLQRSAGGSAKFDRELWANQLGPVLNLWKKLNQGSDLIKMKADTTASKENESPITAFVTLEYQNALSLIHSIHNALSSLSKVIRGTMLLTSDIANLAADLLNNETPMKWQTKWEGPEDIMAYLRAIVFRANSVTKEWIEKVKKDQIFSTTLDLCELFRPDVFLNAFKQMTARKTGTSMDNLKLVASWKGQIQGASIHMKLGGLRVEGCVFDGKRLVENQRNSPSLSPVPEFLIAWLPNDASEPYSLEESIVLPIYTSAEREKLVGQVGVPCGGDQAVWLQCGAAFFLRQ